MLFPSRSQLSPLPSLSLNRTKTNLIARTPNLDERLRRHRHLSRLRLGSRHRRGVRTGVMRVLGGPSSEVRLMFLSLGVGEV